MRIRFESPVPIWGERLQSAADTVMPGPLRGRSRLVLDVVVVLLVLALPQFGVLDEGKMQVLVSVGLYIILALGLNIVVGFAGLLDLGYIAFYAIGAYLYAFLASPQFHLHWPFLVIVPIAAIIAGIFGISFGAPTLRLRGDYLAIVTLGFGEIVQIVANNNIFNWTQGPRGIYNVDPVTLFGKQLTTPTQYYYLLVVMAAVVIFCVSRLGSSWIGRAWAAIREDESAARAAGINTVRMKLLAFAIGAMIGGFVGPVFAANEAFVDPTSFTLDQSILVLSMVVLGGMGSVRGVILGAALLVIIPETLRSYAEYRFVVVGMIMVIMMIARPGGLLPSRARSAEMLRGRRTQALNLPSPGAEHAQPVGPAAGRE
jgi:branched-chain amino acid transport system permease protein